MKLNIKGEYVFNIPVQSMFLNEKLSFKKENIITFFGESFFLNRLINNNFNPIQYICLGNSSTRPTKSDLTLGNETIRRKCVREVDLDKKQVILTCNFTIREVYGTTEIGVSNDTVLISHDIYEKLDDAVLIPTAGEIEVRYMFNLSTGSFKTGWKIAPETDNLVYYIVETNVVENVYEENGVSYTKLNSKQDVMNTLGSFYYDFDTKNLYLRPVEDINPDKRDIIIQTK